MKFRLVVVLACLTAALFLTATCPAGSSTSQLTCPQHKEAKDANAPADPNAPEDPNKKEMCAIDAGKDADKPKEEPNEPADPNAPEDPNNAPVISFSDFTTYGEDKGPGCDANAPADPNAAPAEPNKTALCAADFGKDVDKEKGCDKDKDPNQADPNKPAAPEEKK